MTERFVVVAFDICSSTNIIEELTLRGDVKRFLDFLTAIKRHLVKKQESTQFETYKFTGDGWILLFPANTRGEQLSAFLVDLCQFFRTEFRTQILKYLATPPDITGLTFGLEEGPLESLTMYQRTEYVGRALNVACRLQSALKDKDGSPAYKALVSKTVSNVYFAEASGLDVTEVTRTLRNVVGGAKFRCTKVALLPR